MSLPPLPLRAVLRRRPWGGARLERRWPEAEADREEGVGPFGEAWLAGPESRVAAGPHAGAELSALAALHGEALLGSASRPRYGDRFPLLLKLLDAAEPLSVQVHPDDTYALRHERASGHLGKTEAWWVLEAEAGSIVWWGFRRATDRHEVTRAVAEARLAELLRVVPVSAGDVVVNPAGTVHALGAGLTVFEVQQASDLTYRLFDHGRLRPDGRGRQLHLEQALAVARYEPGAALAPAPTARGAGRRELARTHAFVLERLDATAAAAPEWTVTDASFELITHLPAAGAATPGRLAWDGGEEVVAPHATWLLPAATGPVRLSGAGRYARVRVPAAPASA